MDTRATWLVERLPQDGARLALVYAPLHALCAALGSATTPAGAEAPVLWLGSGLLGAVVCSTAPAAWPWLLMAATLAEFLARVLIGAGGTADLPAAAHALLALTTTIEAFIGGSLFRIGMEQRRPPPAEQVVMGLFFVVAAVGIGAASRLWIARQFVLDGRITVENAWAAPLLGVLAIAPLALALGFNARGHAGRSDGSRRELLLALVATFGVGGYVFSSATSPGNISINYLLFPPLIWLGARFRPRLTFAVSAALCIGVSVLHARGFGPFAAAGEAAATATLGLQIFMIMLLATALLVTMTRHEFRLLQLRLLENNHRLVAAEAAGRLAAGIQLHDGVGQTLTALSLSLSNLLRAPQLERDLAAQLERCRQLTGEAHASTRQLLAELHPPGLRDLGLAAAIESLIERLQSRDQLRVAFRRSGNIDPQPLPRRQLLYRCIRELLANVARHAGVDRAELSVCETAGAIEIEVRDQGSGWDTATWQSSYSRGNCGLFGLKSQVELQGGQIDVTSAPGGGCHVRVRLPRRGA